MQKKAIDVQQNSEGIEKGMAARGEGRGSSVGGRSGRGRRGGRVSSSTEPIQTRNLSYQFLLGGVAKSSPVRLGVRYINATEFCRPRRGRARFHASRESHRHHRRPSSPVQPPLLTPFLSLSGCAQRAALPSASSAFVPQRFRRLLVRVYPDYVAEYTSGRVFAPASRPSFHRRVSFRPVNYACTSPIFETQLVRRY